MKKLFVFMSMAAAAFSFAGCQVDEMDAPITKEEGSTFELVANIAQTKTTLDVANGYKVDWETGDIIYMVTAGEGTPWETAAEFTYADGKFSTTEKLADGTYTMNALYAVSGQAPYHKNTGTTHKLQSTQTQDCNEPTAHIKNNDALIGTFEVTTPLSSPASVNMHHLYTLMQVNVTNTTGAAIEVTKFEMTAAGADLAGVFNVTAFDTPALTTKQDASSKITLNVTGGTVENNASLPVYFVMAPLADYAGKITFKVTDSEGNTYTKTVTMNGISFEAGKYNTTTYTIKEADEVQAKVTWDLSKDQTSEATDACIAWDSDYVIMNSTRKSSQTTAANNYYPGVDKTSTRFYKDNTFNLKPKEGYAMTSATFVATTESYATTFVESKWTNAILSSDKTTVTLIPSDGTLAVAAVLGGTAGFTSVVVNIVPVAEYEKPEAPKLTSITISDQKTDYYVDDVFEFDGTVTANYSYGSPKSVTGYTVSSPDMSSEGSKVVTVTYTEGGVTVSATYNITLIAKPIDDDKPTDGPLVWTLVTNVLDLAVGDEIIIAAKDDAVALSTTQNKNNRGQTPITKSGNIIDEPSASVQKLTLEAGATSGSFAFNTGAGYLYAASSSSNYLKTETTLSANSSWKITITSDGTATLVAKGSNERNTMQYNPSNSLFACYSSASQGALAIYKQMPSSGDSGEIPDPDPENPSTEVGKTAMITFGTNNVKISAASVTGKDSQNNTWTITTVGTTSFTSNGAYYQVGSSSKPATSITFTTTLPSTASVTSVEAKFGGFSGTSGDVTLKVGDTSVGTGELSATSDVVVTSTSTASGNKVTVTITNISKGVKCYYISVNYTD